MKSVRLPAWLAISVLAHGIAVGGYVEYKHRPLRNLVASWFSKKAKQDPQHDIRKKFHKAGSAPSTQPSTQKSSGQLLKGKLKQEIAIEREALIHKARQQLKEGKLELGEFILQANYLDAKESGKPFDLREAREKYLTYLDGLKSALRRGHKLQDALYDVLGGVSYYGIDGRMADVLFEGGGRCETVSHLIVALMYDSGFKTKANFRVYDGHLAPIFRYNGREYDLMAGMYSYKKGVLMSASQIVRIYRDGKFIYPPTRDRYKGIVPLFARNAIQKFDPKKRMMFREDEEVGSDAAFAPVLEPIPSPPLHWPSDFLHVQSLSLPNEKEVEDLCLKIEYLKRRLQTTKTKIGMLKELAHISALYDIAKWNLKLLGRYGPADAAEKERKKINEAAEAIIEETGDRLPEELEKERDSWTLVFIGPKGTDALFRFADIALSGPDSQDLLLKLISLSADNTRDQTFPLLLALDALIANPSSRERAVRFVSERLNRINQVTVMRFLAFLLVDMHGRDEFYRVFEAYNGIKTKVYPELSFYDRGSLGPLSFNKLLKEIREQLGLWELEKEWEIAFIGHYGYISLANRERPVFSPEPGKSPEAFPFVQELAAWLNENQSPELEKLKKMADHIVAKGRFDSETWKEARKLVGID